MAENVKCPKCGGLLTYETFGQYGHAHKISANGRIQKSYKTLDYGGGDVMLDMIYCASCGNDVTSQCVRDGMTVKMDGGAMS